MRGKIAVMDHTGHTEIALEGMTREEVTAKFWEIVGKPSEGGKGMVLAAGATLDDLVQVRTTEEFFGIIEAAEQAGTEPKFLARGAIAGG